MNGAMVFAIAYGFSIFLMGALAHWRIRRDYAPALQAETSPTAHTHPASRVERD